MRYSIIFLGILVALFFNIENVSAQSSTFFDIVVIDKDAGTNARGALFAVNSTTGERMIVSDFGDPVQGPLGFEPRDVIIGDRQNVWVIDSNAGTNNLGALFNVTNSGERFLIGDFGDETLGLPLGFSPLKIAHHNPWYLYVLDGHAGTDHFGAVFTVNKISGQRTIVSDFGNHTQGDRAYIAIDISDNYDIHQPYVALTGERLDFAGAMYNVTTSPEHSRIPISLFDDPAQGALTSNPWAFDRQDFVGNLFLTHNDMLAKLNPVTGFRTEISDFTNTSLGPAGQIPVGIDAHGLNNVLVLFNQNNTNPGILVGINYTTGDRYMITDFDNENYGPRGISPSGVARIPEDTTLSLGTFSSSVQIPQWVRINAGWWSDGLISDVEYVTGIKWLVDNGIMRIR